MLTALMSPDYAPFVLAFVLMLSIGIIEAIGLGAGEVGADVDVPDADHGLLDWLGIGSQLPLLVWLTSLLACFSLAGVFIQQASTAFFGSSLHWLLASAGALGIGGFANRYISRGIARVFPTFETTVITTDDLIAQRGTIMEGSARRNHPARAKVFDHHKQAHFVMVEPEYDDDIIQAGKSVLLVRKEGTTFFALPD